MSKSSETRATILNKAFELIYVNGYQSTSIDDIIATTQVTKGAFYYHFGSKEVMGLAVINEIVFPEVYQGFIRPLEESDKPVKDIYKMIRNILFNTGFFKIEYGCPVSNLTQEMSPLSLTFRAALNRVAEQCGEALRECLKRGRKAGRIRSGTSEDDVALFILAGYWGVRNMGKLQQNEVCYSRYLEELKHYLKSLQ